MGMHHETPGDSMLMPQGNQTELLFNDPDKEKLRIVNEHNVAPHMAEQMKYIHGKWMFGDNDAESHFKAMNDAYKNEKGESENTQEHTKYNDIQLPSKKIVEHRPHRLVKRLKK